MVSSVSSASSSTTAVQAVRQAAGDALASLIGGSTSTSSTSSVASGLINAALAGSRPNFELQFNALQNAWIGRISIKVEEYQALEADENLTVDLDRQRARAAADAENIGDYVDRQGSNRSYLEDISDNLTLMSIELDPTEFARLRDEVVHSVDLLKTTFMDEYGIPDGLQQLKNRFASGFDLSGSPATSGAFETLTVGELSSAQIVQIKGRVDSTAFIVSTNRETSLAQQESLTNELADLDTQISNTKGEILAAKMNEINELRSKAAQALNIVSLSFEGANNQVSQLAGGILPQSNSRGSVLNLFT